MAIKKDTTFKIIGTLCLVLCAVSIWYYLGFASPASNTPPFREGVVLKENNILAVKGFYENFKQPSYQNIASYIRERKAKIVAIGVLVCLILYLIHVKLFSDTNISSTVGNGHYNSTAYRYDTQVPKSEAPPTMAGQPDRLYPSSRSARAVDQDNPLLGRKNPSPNVMPQANLLTMEYLNSTFIPKTKSLIKGTPLSPQATLFDASVFMHVVAGSIDIPADVQDAWNQFSHEQKSITVDMKKMFPSYKALLPDIFNGSLLSGQQILFLLDTLVKAFPRLELITCEKDLFGEVISVTTMFDLGFLRGLKDRLSNKGSNTWKHSLLKKITIKSFADSKIQSKMFILFFNQFGIAGWRAEKEESNDVSSRNQIALIKIEALPKQ